MNSERPRLNPRLAIAIGTVGVSFSAIFARLSTTPAMVTVALRLVFTVAVLTPFVLARHRDEIRQLTRRDLVLCGISGMFLAAHFLSWFEALNYTTVAAGAALINTDVIFTAIGFAVFLKGHIPKLGVVAIALTLIGSTAIALGGGGAEGGQLLGNLLAILGALLFSCHLLIGQVQRGHLSTNVYTWLVYSASMLTLLCVCLFTRTPLWGWEGRNYLIALGLAVICTLLGHSMFSLSLGYLSPAYIAAAKLAEPILGTLIAFALFREVPAPLQVVGAAVVLGGIFLYSMAENRPPKPAE